MFCDFVEACGTSCQYWFKAGVRHPIIPYRCHDTTVVIQGCCSLLTHDKCFISIIVSPFSLNLIITKSNQYYYHVSGQMTAPEP